jgi:hypothetical protein
MAFAEDRAAGDLTIRRGVPVGVMDAKDHALESYCG